MHFAGRLSLVLTLAVSAQGVFPISTFAAQSRNHKSAEYILGNWTTADGLPDNGFGIAI